MSKGAKCSVDDLLNLFSEVLSASDVLSAKLMAQVSAAITRERLKMRMNQKDFAGYLGVTQSEISRWEHGDYNFSLKKISEIAATLDMDIDIRFTKMSIKKALDSESICAYTGGTTFVCPSISTTQFKYSGTQSYKSKKEDYSNASICK